MKYKIIIASIIVLVVITYQTYSENIYDFSFKSKVDDLAGILTPEQKDTLENILDSIEEETTNQVFLGIINDLDGIKLEDLSFKLAELYRFGQEIKNNGVLILVALNDRAIRIEIGYGLELVIQDSSAGKIIRNNIVPYFKQNEYYSGLLDGINEIKSYLYLEDVHQYCSMKWDIEHFEYFIEKYPESTLKSDALMFLGRFYEDKWETSLIGSSSKEFRKKSIEYYERYLSEYPLGIRRETVKYELSQVSLNKHDSQRYLKDD